MGVNRNALSNQKVFLFSIRSFVDTSSTVNAFTSLQISSAIFTAQFQDDNSAIGWKLLLAAYAAIALAAIIWLIIAMVKYPKPASKPA